MRGQTTIVDANPQGKFTEGIVKAGQTFYPGMAVVKDASVDLVNGRHTYKIPDSGTDGNMQGAIWIVTDEMLAKRGRGMTSATSFDSYAAGERVSLYCPLAGEELNLLLKNIAGTADDHTKGEILLIDDATGLFIATTGSPQTKSAKLLETITDPTADTQAWCEWAGSY